MKFLLLLAPLSLALVSCLSSDVSFDGEGSPLDSPFEAAKGKPTVSASRTKSITRGSDSLSFPPGTWIETAMPDVPFYQEYPHFGGRPSQILPTSTPAKIIDYKGDYARVELESGQYGYIAGIQIVERMDDSFQRIELPQAPASLELTEEEKLYQLSDEEIMKRIRQRKQSLLDARQAQTEGNGDLQSTDNNLQDIYIPPVDMGADGSSVAPVPEVQGIELE